MTDPKADHRVTVITVCFNSMAVLPGMLDSLPAGAPVVIVDNASTDAEALAALAAERGAVLIRNEVNLGFGVACNQGAAIANTEFLLFLNPDAVMLAGALDALLQAADRYPAASAMNPRIENADGTAYFKRRSPLMARAERMPKGWPTSDREVTILSGSALFVRRVAFGAVGGFDPAIFLYHEDDDLGRRLSHQCGPLMFIRAACVRHIGGSSTARSARVAAWKAWHMGRSRVYAMRKHGRPWAFGGSLLGAMGALLSPAVWLSRRKRAKQVAFLRGILSARNETRG